MARRWRNRWLELSERSIPVIERLQDEERSGKPAKFSREQVVELFALACCEPEDYGRPISDWRARELAEEIVKQGIVESISPRHVGRLLESDQIKPHQSRYWLTPPLVMNLMLKLKTSTIAQKWHLIMDCLNIHQSESFVRLVVELEGLEIDLGIKGE